MTTSIYKRGEIATIIAIGTLIVLAVSTIVSSTLISKTKQTTQSKAAETCADQGKCTVVSSGQCGQACDNLAKCDINGGCNPACCIKNEDCAAGQQCNISNGYCAGAAGNGSNGMSCNDQSPTLTPVPTTTVTPPPDDPCEAKGGSYYQECCAKGYERHICKVGGTYYCDDGSGTFNNICDTSNGPDGWSCRFDNDSCGGTSKSTCKTETNGQCRINCQANETLDTEHKCADATYNKCCIPGAVPTNTPVPNTNATNTPTPPVGCTFIGSCWGSASTKIYEKSGKYYANGCPPTVTTSYTGFADACAGAGLATKCDGICTNNETACKNTDGTVSSDGLQNQYCKDTFGPNSSYFNTAVCCKDELDNTRPDCVGDPELRGCKSGDKWIEIGYDKNPKSATYKKYFSNASCTSQAYTTFDAACNAVKTTAVQCKNNGKEICNYSTNDFLSNKCKIIDGSCSLPTQVCFNCITADYSCTTLNEMECKQESNTLGRCQYYGKCGKCYFKNMNEDNVCSLSTGGGGTEPQTTTVAGDGTKAATCYTTGERTVNNKIYKACQSPLVCNNQGQGADPPGVCTDPPQELNKCVPKDCPAPNEAVTIYSKCTSLRADGTCLDENLFKTWGDCQGSYGGVIGVDIFCAAATRPIRVNVELNVNRDITDREPGSKPYILFWHYLIGDAARFTTREELLSVPEHYSTYLNYETVSTSSFNVFFCYDQRGPFNDDNCTSPGRQNYPGGKTPVLNFIIDVN